MEWKDIVALISLAVTTFSVCFLAYVALRQRSMDIKLELARLDSARRGRRQSRKTKELSEKTDAQTRVLEDTHREVTKLEANTNGIKESLLKETAAHARADGLLNGMTAITTEALKVKVEKTESQPVIIENPEPIPVRQTK